MIFVKYKNKEKGKEKYEAFFDEEENKIRELEKENDILETRQISSFSECENKAEESALKRCLGLPVTKNLRYMQKENDDWKEDVVKGVEIAEEYPLWCLLDVRTANNGTRRIHHAFFSHMQKPSFAEDMAKSEEDFK